MIYTWKQIPQRYHKCKGYILVAYIDMPKEMMKIHGFMREKVSTIVNLVSQLWWANAKRKYNVEKQVGSFFFFGEFLGVSMEMVVVVLYSIGTPESV